MSDVGVKNDLQAQQGLSRGDVAVHEFSGRGSDPADEDLDGCRKALAFAMRRATHLSLPSVHDPADQGDYRVDPDYRIPAPQPS